MESILPFTTFPFLPIPHYISTGCCSTYGFHRTVVSHYTTGTPGWANYTLPFENNANSGCGFIQGPAPMLPLQHLPCGPRVVFRMVTFRRHPTHVNPELPHRHAPHRSSPWTLLPDVPSPLSDTAFPPLLLVHQRHLIPQSIQPPPKTVVPHAHTTQVYR